MVRTPPPPGIDLRRVAREQRPDLARATFCAVLRQTAYLSVPLCLQRALDEGVVPGEAAPALRWGLALLGVAVAQALFMAGWTYWTNLADARATTALRTRLARHLGSLDRGATADLGQGDVVLRATRDAELVGAWVHGRPALWVIGLTFCFVLPAVWSLDTGLLLVALSMIPVVAAVSLYHRPRLVRAHQGLSSAHGGRADAVEDLLSASTAVRGLGGERVLVRRHHELSGLLARATMRAARTSAAWESQGAAVPRVAIAVGLLVGGLGVLAGRMSVGGLVAFTTWMLALEMATHVLIERLADRTTARVAIDRIDEVLTTRPAVADPPFPVPLPASGALVAHGLVWRPGAPPLDLDVDPGDVVVLTGPTGSGKSSVLRLLARTRPPVAGRVTFGGVPLAAASREDVERRILLVPQRPVLLGGTVRSSLQETGRAPHDDDALLAACHVAAVEDWVRRLPDGLDTRLGERGTTLSGGQRQRLAVARAVVRAPAVLLLDDVTSALDPDTEAELLTRLRRWAGTRTALVLAGHRPAVLDQAGTVVPLAAGRVADRAGGRLGA